MKRMVVDMPRCCGNGGRGAYRLGSRTTKARLALAGLLVATAAPAQATDAPRSSPDAVGTAAESARESALAVTHWLASGLDSWFGDRPFQDGGQVSDGRLSLGVLKRQRESAEFSLRFNARLRLPNLEDRTYLFLGRDDPREVLTDQPGALSRQERPLGSLDDRRFFAGVGRNLDDRLDFRLGLRGGLKAYAQLRYRRQWEVGTNGLAEFRQTLFWSVADRAGSTTAYSYEHLLSPTLAARWLTSATITQASRRFEWSQLLGAYQAFGDQRLLALEGVVNGRQGSGVPATDYGLQLRWEQPVHHDWLIGGLVVGHFRPRPDAQSPRQDAWALGASLRMRF